MNSPMEGTDIVTRLRAYIPVEGQEGIQIRSSLMREAATEIERLRKEMYDAESKRLGWSSHMRRTTPL